MTNFIFAYGSFLRNLPDDQRKIKLEDYGKYLGPASTTGKMFYVDPYCGVVPDPQGGVIIGDLFKIDPTKLDETLSILDETQKCSINFPSPHEFERIEVSVRFNTKTVFAWMYAYIYPNSVLEYLPEGDYLEFFLKIIK